MEEEKDLKERVEGFIKEMNPLMGKYELGLGATADLTQDGRVEAKAVFVSTRKPPAPAKEAEGESKSVDDDKGGLSE
jgi:hypothetical protein